MIPIWFLARVPLSRSLPLDFPLELLQRLRLLAMPLLLASTSVPTRLLNFDDIDLLPLPLRWELAVFFASVLFLVELVFLTLSTVSPLLSTTFPLQFAETRLSKLEKTAMEEIAALPPALSPHLPPLAEPSMDPAMSPKLALDQALLALLMLSLHHRLSADSPSIRAMSPRLAMELALLAPPTRFLTLRLASALELLTPTPTLTSPFPSIIAASPEPSSTSA